MRGVVVALFLLFAFSVALLASAIEPVFAKATPTPATAHTSAQMSVTAIKDSAKSVLTSLHDSCCLDKHMKRNKRAGPCKADCSGLPPQLIMNFIGPVAAYAVSRPHHSNLAGHHRLLRPPIS